MLRKHETRMSIEELREELERERAKAKDAAKDATCPSCGHCPTCGRGGVQVLPSYPVPMPIYPPPVYPWQPGSTSTWIGIAPFTT